MERDLCQPQTFCCSPDELSEAGAKAPNNYSLATVFNYHGLMIVFPGDLEPDGWDAMMDNTDFEQEVEKGTYRILVAPHHGRASGVRRNQAIYTRFLEAIKPDLVIISDKYGNHSTDPDAYRGWANGLDVVVDGQWVRKEVITTKTNDCVSIQVEMNNLVVKLF